MELRVSSLSLSLKTIEASFSLLIFPFSITSGKAFESLSKTLKPGVMISFATWSD